MFILAYLTSDSFLYFESDTLGLSMLKVGDLFTTFYVLWKYIVVFFGYKMWKFNRLIWVFSCIFERLYMGVWVHRQVKNKPLVIICKQILPVFFITDLNFVYLYNTVYVYITRWKIKRYLSLKPDVAYYIFEVNKLSHKKECAQGLDECWGETVSLVL